MSIASSTLQTETNSSPLPDGIRVEVFYDGACPLCRKEIAMLKKWDRRNQIQFTDITAEDFSPESVGITYDELMAEIHGKLPTGEVILGVEVFRQLYSAVGLGWIVACTRVPGVSHILDFGYHMFAKNRLKLTGRCSDDVCKI